MLKFEINSVFSLLFSSKNKSSKELQKAVFFVFSYVFLFIYLFSNGYYLGDSTFWMGVLVLPFTLIISRLDKKSWRFFVPTVLLLIANFLIPIFSIKYLLLAFALLWVIESLVGKVSILALITLLLMSSYFRYFTETFTFPIRLQLSEWVGKILMILAFPVEINGNMIQFKGNDFSVDPACMGLSMMGISLLFSIFLLAHYQRITKKTLAFWWIILILILVFGLNILSNLFRMILLVIGQILPQNPLHDLVGVLCLLVYVWLPSFLLIRWIFSKHTISTKNLIEKPLASQLFWFGSDNNGFLKTAIHILSLSVISYFIFQKKPNQNLDNQLFTTRKENFESTKLSNGITRLTSKNALVYVKPIADFYSGEHNPSVCWKGSGYDFKQIKEENFGAIKIYTAVLHNKTDKLYTAWWFSNGKHQTNSQLDWRWRVLKGEKKFDLINITASSDTELKAVLKDWL